MSIIDKGLGIAGDFVDGSSTIADAMGRKKRQSPQYDFLWRVELPMLDTASPGNFLEEALSGIMGQVTAPDEINHRIDSIETPFFQFDTKKVTNKNTYWYTASNNDIGQITLSVQDMEDGGTLKYFTDWKNLIQNDDGTYNPPAEYKKTIKFYRLSATKLDLHVYTYEGFFVSEIQTMNNTYDSNDITTYSITLAGDDVKYEFMSGTEVQSKVMMKEIEIMGKQWVNDKVKIQNEGLSDILQTAGGLS